MAVVCIRVKIGGVINHLNYQYLLSVWYEYYDIPSDNWINSLKSTQEYCQLKNSPISINS